MNDRNRPSDYRVYLRDREDHIVSVSDLNCTTDSDGLKLARAIKDAVTRELWQGSRMVARLDADGNEMSLGQ